MCEGNQVVFICQETRSNLRWTVNLPEGSSINRLTVDVSSSQAGSVLNFVNEDPFGFEIHVLSSSSDSVKSELRVTAVRGLNGATVKCVGPGRYPSSTIHISSVGESV